MVHSLLELLPTDSKLQRLQPTAEKLWNFLVELRARARSFEFLISSIRRLVCYNNTPPKTKKGKVTVVTEAHKEYT